MQAMYEFRNAKTGDMLAMCLYWGTCNAIYEQLVKMGYTIGEPDTNGCYLCYP